MDSNGGTFTVITDGWVPPISDENTRVYIIPRPTVPAPVRHLDKRGQRLPIRGAKGRFESWPRNLIKIIDVDESFYMWVPAR